MRYVIEHSTTKEMKIIIINIKISEKEAAKKNAASLIVP